MPTIHYPRSRVIGSKKHHIDPMMAMQLILWLVFLIFIILLTWACIRLFHYFHGVWSRRRSRPSQKLDKESESKSSLEDFNARFVRWVTETKELVRIGNEDPKVAVDFYDGFMVQENLLWAVKNIDKVDENWMFPITGMTTRTGLRIVDTMKEVWVCNDDLEMLLKV